MAEITVAQIGKLRQQTGAGMMDCKKALSENNGDPVAAETWIREKKKGKMDQRTFGTAGFQFGNDKAYSHGIVAG